MKRDSKYSGNYREELSGEKLYGRNVEPVLELHTEYECIRLCWVRPLQRQSIDENPYLLRLVS